MCLDAPHRPWGYLFLYIPAMAVFVKKEPWKAITKAVNGCDGRIYAASGYVGSGAYDLLPLRKGDVLVCDASPPTVRNGSTDPRALRPFLKAGVEVWSKAGLHAKVIVLPKRAFVGSANASSNSANRLFEATLETTVTHEVRQLRAFVQDLCLSRVTESVIQDRETMVPKRPRVSPLATDPAKLPMTLDRLMLIDLTNDYLFTKQELRAEEKGTVIAKEKARNSSTKYALGNFAFPAAELTNLHDGEWVLQVVDGKPEALAVVVHKEVFGKRGVAWLATPKTAVAATDLRDLGLKPALKEGEVRRVRAREARRLLDLHRALEDSE